MKLKTKKKRKRKINVIKDNQVWVKIFQYQKNNNLIKVFIHQLIMSMIRHNKNYKNFNPKCKKLKL